MRRFSASRVARAARPCRRCDSFSRAMRYSRRAPGSTLRSASSRSSSSSRVLSSRQRAMSARPASRVSLARSGSSPRVRGKALRAPAHRQGLGIIPAGAGKRSKCLAASTARRDHPRGCGEKPTKEIWRAGSAGSSPRVRGKAEGFPSFLSPMGIIPAGAGKRGEHEKQGQEGQDHPRGCGEKRGGTKSQEMLQGSSPRVRGKACLSSFLGLVAGIIPAGAGKRLMGGGRAGGAWDHPRGCGEKSNAKTGRYIPIGSSPRVRGKD